MGKSDRAFVFGALGLWIGVAAALPDWARVGHAGCVAALLVAHDRQPRAARPRRSARRCDERRRRRRRARRAGARAHVPHARRRRPLLSPLAGAGRPRARRDRAVPPRPRALGAHGAPRRRARPAGLRLLRLGRARPRPLARRARRRARASRTRCATCRRSSTTSRRRTASPIEDIARRRAKRRRRAGRGVGARLRAAHPLHGARVARVQGQALRAVRARRARADAQAARQLLRQQLRQGEVPDARPRAHRELRRRSADRAADLGATCCSGLYDAVGARRRRRAGDRRADAAPDLRRRLGRAPRRRSTRSSTGWARRSRSGTCCTASITTRWASAIARRPIARVRAFLLRRFDAAARAAGPARRRPARASRARRPTRSRAPLPRAVAARPVLGARRARACASAARCPTACALGHATGFDSGSTLDYVYRNQPRGVTPLGRADRPQLPRLDRLARHPPAQAPSRGAAAHGDRAIARAAGAPVRIVDIAAGHGRYVLDAIADAGARARFDPAARLQRAQRRAGQRADPRARVSTASRASCDGDAFDRASLAAIAPRPTIGIVSGLYELFPDNAHGARRRSPGSPTRSRPAAC